MDHFHRAGCRQGERAGVVVRKTDGVTDGVGRGQREAWTQPLAAAHQRVPQRLVDRCGRSQGAKRPLERRLDDRTKFGEVGADAVSVLAIAAHWSSSPSSTR